MTEIDTGRAAARRVLATRRGLMCGAAGLGAASALAACGTADTPSGSGEDTGGEGDGGGVLAQTSEVPVGGGIVVDGTVIVQPAEDEFLAFDAACPHMGTLVEPPDGDGVIVCPGHFSEFDMEGGLLKGPAETGLTEVAVTVEDGGITLA
ncbi:MAG TPA: Rieske (2Fe-2S) protein [Glycomyces sp.]|nr:Rieske (2Fe-2S) protein [Glycomyces sp.]